MKTKRIIPALIIVSLLIGGFALLMSGVISPILASLINSFKEEKEKTPIFECGAMTLELTTDFEDNFYSSGHDYMLVSEDYEILIDSITITSPMPDGGFTLADLEEFMSYYACRFFDNPPEYIDLYTIDGILYYDADTNHDGKIDKLFAMYKYQNTFWIVFFRPIYSTFEEAKDQFLAWSKNVSFPAE